MKTYHSFLETGEIDIDYIHEDVDTLIQHIKVDEETSEKLVLEGISSVVSAVSGALVIKCRSLRNKMKGEKDMLKRQDILAEMILLSTYGSMVGAASAVKNQSLINKFMKGGRR